MICIFKILVKKHNIYTPSYGGCWSIASRHSGRSLCRTLTHFTRVCIIELIGPLF